MQLTQASVIIGLDWADRTHVCCLGPREGTPPETVAVDAAPERFGPWLEKVEQRYPTGEIVVAVERADGAAVAMMRARARWVVVAVNPVVLHRFRQAFAPSGAKGDPGDAALLRDIVRTHPEKFAALPAVEPRLEQLAALVRQRRHWVDTRTGLVEQLGALLKRYYPQALKLAGAELSSPLALAFLRAWPDLPAAQQAPWAQVERLYRDHHSGRAAVLVRRRELLAQARAVSVAESYVAPCRLQLLAIGRQIETLNASVTECDQAIASLYAEAPGRAVLDSLPGVGAVLAPRLWVACTQAGATPTGMDLALRSGIAPVQIQSGLSKIVAFRWARSRFLHQTWLEFAVHSAARGGWAGEYCAARKRKGHGKAAIHRALAFKWTRIVARLWRERVPYDETYYLQHRAVRLAA